MTQVQAKVHDLTPGRTYWSTNGHATPFRSVRQAVTLAGCSWEKATLTSFPKMNKEERKREDFTILILYARLIREMMKELIIKFNCQSSEKAGFWRIIP